MQSGKGRQPGKATTGTCNPPPSHLRGSGCAAPRFRQQILFFFWYLPLGFTHGYLKYTNRNFLG